MQTIDLYVAATANDISGAQIAYGIVLLLRGKDDRVIGGKRFSGIVEAEKGNYYEVVLKAATDGLNKIKDKTMKVRLFSTCHYFVDAMVNNRSKVNNIRLQEPWYNFLVEYYRFPDRPELIELRDTENEYYIMAENMAKKALGIEEEGE